MARATILAAGGIVVRSGRKPLIAIVQRRKDNVWVLPKGKLKPNEKAVAAARREVIEETGHAVQVHDFLGAISYRAGNKPKVVQFWQMQAVGEKTHALMDDIKAVEWLPLQLAIKKLNDPLEQVFLRHVGPRALKVATVSTTRPGATSFVTEDGVEIDVEPNGATVVAETMLVAANDAGEPGDGAPADDEGETAGRTSLWSRLLRRWRTRDESWR
jgi:8-oxo-dGTP pyrophosphatase MutT (NUDIX family)